MLIESIGRKTLGLTGQTVNTNNGLFNNLLAGGGTNQHFYWSSSEYNASLAWDFYVDVGSQGLQTKTVPNNMYAMAVRSGEVSVVPIPGAVWLFASGLLGLVGLRKRF